MNRKNAIDNVLAVFIYFFTYIVLAHDFEFGGQAVAGHMFAQQSPAFLQAA
jgi:hypothetical protein